MAHTTSLSPVQTDNIPGPKLLDVLKQVWRSPLDFLVNSTLEYGDVVRVQIRDRTLIVISHPEHVKRVLLDNYKNYIKGYDLAKPLFGNGLVSSDGEFWRRQRRLMQPMFHRRRIALMTETMVAATEEMLNRWERYAQSGRPIDVTEQMMRLTRDIILTTMFSSGIGNVDAEAAGKAFGIALAHLDKYLFSPVQIPEYIPTPSMRRFRRAMNTLNEIVYRLIAERRAMHDRPDDLLTMLIEVKDEETGEVMTDEQIRDEVVTIFLAGHETTANALSWTWYLLSKHPSTARRLWAELDETLAGRTPQFEDVSNLPFTRMVFQESMRLYPPAWLFARSAVEDDMLGEYTIPAGSTILISPYVTHRRPDLWEDPLGFDPERFTPERSANRHRFAYFPFSRGPRVCIGENFAMAEGLLVLAAVGQRYRLDLVPGHPVVPQTAGTLRPKQGILMTVHAR